MHLPGNQAQPNSCLLISVKLAFFCHCGLDPQSPSVSALSFTCDLCVIHCVLCGYNYLPQSTQRNSLRTQTLSFTCELCVILCALCDYNYLPQSTQRNSLRTQTLSFTCELCVILCFLCGYNYLPQSTQRNSLRTQTLSFIKNSNHIFHANYYIFGHYGFSDRY
jgi:hypothetical protein